MNQPTDSELEARTMAFFAQDGPLSRRNPAYQIRAGQLEMAKAVARAISQGDSLVVEAGTGIGKTYAYLAAALASGKRTVISTATKALQDQLFERDLPAVADAWGLPVRISLLKGRSNYLCRHRLGQAWQRLPGHDRPLARLLGGVESWAACTVSGDLSEMPGLEERADLMALVTSTRDNCLGSRCPALEGCHLHAARRQALAADVVVINHHLFFADQAMKSSGMAELLPSADVVIFDEAHQLLETGVQFLGESVSTSQLLDFVRDLQVLGLQEARGWQAWADLAHGLEQPVRHLRQAVEGAPISGARLDWSGMAPEGIEPGAWASVCQAVAAGLQSCIVGLASVAEHSMELRRLHERGEGLAQSWAAMTSQPNDATARWLDVEPGLRLVRAPLDLRQGFGDAMKAVQASQGKTWVFTSATLGADQSLAWFSAPLGLEQLTTLRVNSPFDYPNQAAVHVPPELPTPQLPGHSVLLARAIWPWIMRLGGRTLVLTTTLKALTACTAELSRLSIAELGPVVLAQGQAPKRELLQHFRRAGASQGGGAVLVASASFWEGVDLAGDCLQMVVIDKLPFPPPDDPWVQARSKALQHQGERPFNRYFMPEAAVSLRQGAGRLIRSELDMGLLVIGDTRLRTMGYGRRLMAALPPMRVLDSEGEVTDWLDHLVTTVSTRDLPWT